MELNALRIFIRAAELSSFSKAAVSAGVAQPTVSRIIGELESEWSGPLFYRTGRGVTLSELGEEALARARFLLREADQASEDLRAFSQQPSGTVSLGLPTSLIEPIVPVLVDEMRSSFPGIRLQIYEGFGDQIERWLADGTIDIGAYSKYLEGAKTQPLLLGSPLVLAGLREDWAIPEEIDFERLADYDLVLPARTNGLRVMVESVARRLKVPLNIIANVDSTIGQKAVATHCRCYMVKAPYTIADDMNKGAFATSVIRNPSIVKYTTLVTGRQRPLSRASREVAARLTSVLRQFGETFISAGREPNAPVEMGSRLRS